MQDESLPRYQRNQPVIRRKLQAFETMLSEWYEYDLKRPKRERRTAKKFYEQLLEAGYTGSYTSVCRFSKTTFVMLKSYKDKGTQNIYHERSCFR